MHYNDSIDFTSETMDTIDMFQDPNDWGFNYDFGSTDTASTDPYSWDAGVSPMDISSNESFTDILRVSPEELSYEGLGSLYDNVKRNYLYQPTPMGS